jgi:DnaK suppressor protein
MASMVHGPGPSGDALEAIVAARRRTVRRIAALEQTVAVIIEGSEHTSTDDEHDPEGATIAFERQQVAALLEQARRRLADVETALVRREAGNYGVCESCGRPIAAERLAARPAARTCIACAR